jgi:hypothetical protein
VYLALETTNSPIHAFWLEQSPRESGPAMGVRGGMSWYPHCQVPLQVGFNLINCYVPFVLSYYPHTVLQNGVEERGRERRGDEVNKKQILY